MNSSAKNTVIFLLALGALAGGALAWRQHRELAALRAANRSAVDRPDLRRELAAAQRRVRALEDALAAGRPAPERAGAEMAAPPRDAGEFERGRGGRGGPGGRGESAMRALMDSPQAQQLLQQQQRLALDGRYAALFKNLNLAPEKLDQFKTLLLEKQTVMQDVMAAARTQGVDPRESPTEFRKMVAAAHADLDGSLKTLLGDEGFTQYDQYQKTLPQRNVVNQLEQSLSYTNAPLSPTQANQLVQILASTTPPTTARDGGEGGFEQRGRGGFGGPMGGSGPGGPGGPMGGGAPTVAITSEAVKMAEQVLSAPQVAALQQLQQIQQAQKQFGELMRGGRGESRGGRE